MRCCGVKRRSGPSLLLISLTLQTRHKTPCPGRCMIQPPSHLLNGCVAKQTSFLTEEEDNSSQQRDRPSTEQQITVYYMQPATPAYDPTEFWKGARTTCLSLAALSRHMLTIPGSSVPREPLLSTMGLIVVRRPSYLR